MTLDFMGPSFFGHKVLTKLFIFLFVKNGDLMRLHPGFHNRVSGPDFISGHPFSPSRSLFWWNLEMNLSLSEGGLNLIRGHVSGLQLPYNGWEDAHTSRSLIPIDWMGSLLACLLPWNFKIYIDPDIHSHFFQIHIDKPLKGHFVISWDILKALKLTSFP